MSEKPERVTGPSRQMLPLVFVYFLLVVLLWPVLGEWLGRSYAAILVFGIIALISLSFIREAVSPSAFERVAARYPGIRRESWMLNVLMRDVVIPLAATALFATLA